MRFIRNSNNFKKAQDQTRNITVELDYTDSDNKKVIYHNNEYSASLIIVDQRNSSCDVYLQQDTTQEVIDGLKEALPLLGLDYIFFQEMD